MYQRTASQLVRLVCFLVAVLSASAPLLAADGAPDPTFNSDGIRDADYTPNTIAAGDIVAVGNGQLVYAMTLTVQGVTRWSLCDIARDGSAGTGCDYADFELAAGAPNRVYALAANRSGSRVVAVGSAGEASPPSNASRVGIAAFKTSPTFALDTTFGGGDGMVTVDFTGNANAVAVTVLPDGRIAWAGWTIVNGTVDTVVGMQLANGTSDGTFGAAGRVVMPISSSGAETDYPTSIAWDERHQRLLVGGTYELGGGDMDVFVAAFELDGQLDTSFAGNGLLQVGWDISGLDVDMATALAIDRFGRTVVGGVAWAGNQARAVLMRLTGAGGFDQSFGTAGIRHLSMFADKDVRSVEAVAILPEPREEIALLGSYDTLLGSPQQGFVAVVPADGNGFQNSFDSDGRRPMPVLVADALQSPQGMAISSGRIVTLTHFPAPNNGRQMIVRLQMSALFGEDFETGDFRVWSTFNPGP